jgi:hypothetical protein
MAQREAGAAADLQKSPCAREKLVCEPDDQRVARDEPKMPDLEIRKCREVSGIHAANGIGKLGRK